MRDEALPEAPAEGHAEAPPGGLWLTIPDAARRLRVTPQAIRDRIRRGTLDTRREAHGNRMKLLVKVDPALAPSPDEGLEQRLAEALPKALERVLAEHVGDLRVRVLDHLQAEAVRRGVGRRLLAGVALVDVGELDARADGILEGGGEPRDLCMPAI